MRLDTLLTIVTREDIVTFVSIIVSIVVALLAVPYAERWQRRRRSGENYQYGLHVLQTLQEADNRQSQEWQQWAAVYKEATKQINSSTDSPDYKRTDKEHSRQLREACFKLLIRRGVLVMSHSEQIPDDKSVSEDKYNWVEKQLWRVSGLGSKVLQRTTQRESRDEQYAVFERFYRGGVLPPPIAGEEYGQHHHEYLERILPARGASGDFVVRADDETSIGFLVRARANLGEDANDQLVEVTFRYIEFPVGMSSPIAIPPVVRDPADVRQKVDEVWPADGLLASRPWAHQILANLSDRGASTSGGVSYDIPALHYLAWNHCRDDIVRVWSSGADESAFRLTVPDQLKRAVEFLDESSTDFEVYDEQSAALNRSYPDEVVKSVQDIMDDANIDKTQRIDALCQIIEERNLGKIRFREYDSRSGLTKLNWIRGSPFYLWVPENAVVCADQA